MAKKKATDKTWSIKHEGKLNPDNIIFTNNKYKELISNCKKVDDNIKNNRVALEEDPGDLVCIICNTGSGPSSEPMDCGDEIYLAMCNGCKDWGEFVYENSEYFDS
tara:strand:+ start:64 stop:381 length:318 start_codon:yes stop_codon:yes gene_type:complete